MRMRLSRRAVTSTAVLGLMGAAAGIAPSALAGKPPAQTISVVQFAPNNTALTATEGQPGALSFVVNRTNTTGTALFFVTLVDGTTNGATDYSPQNWNPANPVSIGPGATTFTGLILIANDSIAETTETMTIRLTSASSLTQIGKKNAANVTIYDNDPCPAVNVGDASATEGTPPPPSGGNPLTFTVSTVGAATCALPIQVHWATAATSTGGGVDATPGTDFTSASGNVAIPAGSTSTTFNVLTIKDSIDELDQTFNVVLSAPVNTTIADGTGLGTINDDDAPTITATIGPDQTVWAGADATFTVNLSGTSEAPVVVTVVTDDADNPAGAVVSDSPGTDITFAPGDTSKPYTVHTNATTAAAPNTLGWVEIASAQHANFSDPATTDCGPGCDTDSWGRLHMKNTVPYNTTVATDAAGGTATSGTTVTETVTVANQSGDPLPGVVIRGELYRDFDFSSDFEADGNLIAETGPSGATTDSNGQVVSSYTDSNGFDEGDYLFACVPGMAGASLSDCGVVTGFESGDNEDIFTLPTPPSTTGYTTVHWTP